WLRVNVEQMDEIRASQDSATRPTVLDCCRFPSRKAAPGTTAVEEQEAFEDLVNTFGTRNKNFPGGFEDDLHLADPTMGEPQGDGEYDEAFNEPLGIEDEFCDRSASGNLPQNLSHAHGHSYSLSPQHQNGGGAYAGRNYSNSPALTDQHQVWNSGRKEFKESQALTGVQGHQFQRPGSEGSAPQSLPVGQASRFQRPPQGPQVTQGNPCQGVLSGQGNQFQGPPSTQVNRFQRPLSAQGNQVQRPPVAQHNQFQRPPQIKGNQFQRPPHTEGIQFQRPPNEQVNQIHELSSRQFQQPQYTQNNQFQRPPNTQVSQIQKSSVLQGYQLQPPPYTQGNRLQRPSSQFLRAPACQSQRPSGTQGSQLQRPPFLQNNQIQRPPNVQSVPKSSRLSVSKAFRYTGQPAPTASIFAE
ncbi:putative N66 matrix protein-like, partial [Penaeus vannamei]